MTIRRMARRGALAALTLSAASLVAAPFVLAGADDEAALVARGEVLAFVAGCHDCHTPGALYGAPDAARALSGSELGWSGPWGVSYPPNITPDVETGIGSWSAEELERALRTGVRPDGSALLPPMPWPYYARMSADDMKALVAYLRGLPPITHVTPPRKAPGEPVSGSVLVMPPPPAWDVPPRPAG